MMLDAGIVGRRKQGLNAYYRITDESVYELCALVSGSIQNQLVANLDNFSAFAATREGQPHERSG